MRAAAVVLAVLAPVFGVITPKTGARTEAQHVVVVGVAGLRWEDVSLETTPSLGHLAMAGSVGSLSVRAAPSVTCPGDGWLTLGAGTYAAVQAPGDVDPREGCSRRGAPLVHPDSSGGAGVPSLPELDSLNRSLRFGARVGWLSRRVSCVAAVGPGAALGGAGAEGMVAHYRETLPEEPADLLSACPVTLVDLGGIVSGGDLARVDEQVGRIRAALPPSSVLMVLGVAETDADRARLHTAVVAGPGFGPGYLRSASTRRVPYVQLCDVAPAVLRALGEPTPDMVAGRPFTGGHSGRPHSLGATIADLADTDQRAVAHRAVLGRFFVVFGVATGVLVVAMAGLLRRRRQRPAVRILCVALSGLPTATFLANLVPWWRTQLPFAALSATVLACTAALAVVAIAVGRSRVRVQVGVVAGVTLVVFAGDAFTGANLQLGSMLGYNPLVAGRFVGFGNIAFGVLGAAAVILASLVAVGRRTPRAAVLSVVAVALPILVLDGSPAWGADFGGVLALVPTFGVLALLVAGAAVSWRRMLLAQLGGFALVGIVGWLDYLRPADQRSHFGRFVGSVVDGGAIATIERKWLTSWELLFKGPHTLAALGLTVGLVVAVFRPPALLRAAYQEHQVLRPMLYATVALALVGFALNDSGVAIPAVIALVAAPTTLALLTDPVLIE